MIGNVADKISQVVMGLADRTNARISLLDPQNNEKSLKDSKKTGYIIKFAF